MVHPFSRKWITKNKKQKRNGNIILWGNSYEKNLQQKAIRITSKLKYRVSNREAYKDLNILAFLSILQVVLYCLFKRMNKKWNERRNNLRLYFKDHVNVDVSLFLKTSIYLLVFEQIIKLWSLNLDSISLYFASQ